MEKRKNLDKSEKIFIGIDLHKRTWHVTIRTFDIELFMEKVIYQIHFLLLGIWASRSSKNSSYGNIKGTSNLARFVVEISTESKLFHLNYFSDGVSRRQFKIACSEEM